MSSSLALAMFVVCSSWLNCAICPMKSVSLVGLSGSRFLSWPTSSLRKSSLPRIESVALVSAPVPVVPVVDVVVGTVGMVVAFAVVALCQDVHERPVGQLDRPRGGRLVGLAGGDHAACVVVIGRSAAVFTTTCLRTLSGDVDLQARERHALLRKAALKLVGGLLQRVCGGGGIGGDGGAEAAGPVRQGDLDAAQLSGL